MKNKLLQSKILLLVIPLLLGSQISVQSQSRMMRNYVKQNKIFNNDNFKKLYDKYNVTDEMLNIQNVNAAEVVDSVVGIDFLGTKFKAIYQYGAHGDIIMDLRQKWDGTKLVNSTRTSTTYNSNGDRTERLSENWSGTDWVADRRLSYTFDANGNKIEELEQDWDGTQLVNASRWRTEFNSVGEPILYINEDWDGSAWVPDYRQSITGESGVGGSIILIEEDWNGTAWINDSRSSTQFDSNGRIISQLEENWDGSAWISRDRTSFEYNSSGSMTSLLSEEWNGSDWINIQRFSYTFNSNGLRTLWLLENWNGTQWENDFRFTYVYDQNENNTENINEEWDGSQWINVSRVSFTYNSNSNMIMGIAESWDNSSWVNSPGSIGFSIGDFSTVFLSYSYFAYSINVFYGSITEVSQNASLPAQYELSQNYPNPFNPSTTIRYNIPNESEVSLAVYNAVGAKVAELYSGSQSAGNFEINWNASDLSSGVYFLRMNAISFQNSKSFTDVKKLILLK